jgi:hypothetical protein
LLALEFVLQLQGKAPSLRLVLELAELWLL